jgi:penicillin amidase
MGEEAFDQFIKAHLSKRQIAEQIGMLKSVWWDDVSTDEVKENREEIFTRSFHEAIATLANRYGGNLENWTWKEAAKVTHKHAFDKSRWLRSFFNIGPFSTHGGNEVINNQLFELNGAGSFEITAGPSTRRVIDFSDVENARAIVPTGQSGNPFSKHYDDQAQQYLDGEFVKMMLNEEEIRASEDRLVLKP